MKTNEEIATQIGKMYRRNPLDNYFDEGSENWRETLSLINSATAPLKQQIGVLSAVLMTEFGGPTRDEGACEMAIRVLRELKQDICQIDPENLAEQRDTARAQLTELQARVKELEENEAKANNYNDTDLLHGDLIAAFYDELMSINPDADNTCSGTLIEKLKAAVELAMETEKLRAQLAEREKEVKELRAQLTIHLPGAATC